MSVLHYFSRAKSVCNSRFYVMWYLGTAGLDGRAGGLISLASTWRPDRVHSVCYWPDKFCKIMLRLRLFSVVIIIAVAISPSSPLRPSTVGSFSRQHQHRSIITSGQHRLVDLKRRRCGLFTALQLSADSDDLTDLKAEEQRLLTILKSVRSRKLLALRSKPLRIAVLGFGRFGQFIAREFKKTGDVVALSRSDYSAEATAMGIQYYPMSEVSTVLKEGVDVLLISTSILSFSSSVQKLAPALRELPATDLPLVVDVLSVKSHPRRVLLSSLPPGCDILSTHPMFGPESGKHSWSGLNFVFEKTRLAGVVEGGVKPAKPLGDHSYSLDRCERFLSIWEEAGCNMVPMSCEDHDRDAANSQVRVSKSRDHERY